MKLTKSTKSLCPTCYKEIPAEIEVHSHGVVMRKECSQHGPVKALLERDPVFYTYITAGLRSPGIYPGLFVDVIRQCNLRCSYCYFALESGTARIPETLSLQSIVDHCKANQHMAPFVFTGGEPTLRHDLHDLITEVGKIGPVEVITNGVRTGRILPHVESVETKIFPEEFHLSIHDDVTKEWQNMVNWCVASDRKLKSILIVIDSKESFLSAIQRARELRSVTQCFRIKAATNLWAEQKASNRVFVSDMLHWLEELGQVTIYTERNNKSVITNVIFEGMLIMLVAWHDVFNVDLLDIDCPPYYLARNGEIANLVTANLINEGMEKGWLNGTKMTNQ